MIQCLHNFSYKKLNLFLLILFSLSRISSVFMKKCCALLRLRQRPMCCRFLFMYRTPHLFRVDFRYFPSKNFLCSNIKPNYGHALGPSSQFTSMRICLFVCVLLILCRFFCVNKSTFTLTHCDVAAACAPNSFLKF